MSLFAHAIPQVDGPRVGFHVLWNGPHTWLYSPAGWFLQRRHFHGRPRLDCLDLGEPALRRLRERHELRIRFGIVTERFGACPAPFDREQLRSSRRSSARSATVPPSCEIITLELETPQPFVRVRVTARSSFAVGLRDGKVVAGGAQRTDTANHDLAAQQIDTVVVYVRGLTALGYCVELAGAEDWRGAAIIGPFQMPLRELDPSLGSPADEYARARSRLLPGESLDADEFAHLAGILRRVVRRDGPPRPIDLALLLRDEGADVAEMVALDPLRAVLPHPRWRRALGFGHFDRSPELVPGDTYQYRVISAFPRVDLTDQVFGFHTIPAATLLPAEHYLGGLRVRLPDPAPVELVAPGAGDVVVTRRGIRLSPDRPSWFLGSGIQGWSAVLDFPTPVSSVVLELGQATHSLTFTAGMAWETPGPDGPVPPGIRPRLDFASPISQLRIGGEGFLCAVRIPASGSGPILALQIAALPPLPLIDQPRPAPPLIAGIANLQQPEPIPQTDVPPGPPAPRHALGFEVSWLPAPVVGIGAWPPDLPPPPTDATLFQIEHAREGTSEWAPLLDEDNLITGHREDVDPPPGITRGADLMQVFPEVSSPGVGNVTLSWSDVFDFVEGGGTIRRAVPEPGTFHKYRVRAVDAIGRASPSWTETPALRLEKWLPPPLPAGASTEKADALSRPAPTGVTARVLVQGSPDLTAAERTLLGSHSNAILLRWGWHAEQRALDPLAAEFRVYATRRRPDAIAGVLESFIELAPGRYRLRCVLDEAIVAEVAARLRLDLGHPFEIVEHEGGPAGTPLEVVVLVRVPGPGGVYPRPRPGIMTFPVRLTPDRTRAPAWGPRIEIQPVTAATTYESLVPIFDHLQLSPDHPFDQVWVGVSSADAQDYVPDPLGDGRPGNESAIVVVPCQGRWLGRPAVVEIPALDPVPMLVTPEPGERPMQTTLDLGPFLVGTSLAGTEIVMPERVSAERVFQAYRLDGGRVLARVLAPAAPGDAEAEVTIGNAGDRAAILAALGGQEIDALADQHLVFLAASHPYRARFFAATTRRPVELPRIDDTLPNRGGRWVYRVRLADAAGRISDDGVTLRGVVRVPPTSELPAPERAAARPGDPASLVRIAIRGSREISHLALFRRLLAAGAPAGVETAELLRVPGAARLAPGEGLRLRLVDGTLLAPEIVDLAAGGAEGVPPSRSVAVDLGGDPGDRWRTWACALTVEGVASALGGAWVVALPQGPVAAPALTATGASPNLVFSWSWPTAADARDVVLEASPRTDELWARVSPRLAAAIDTRIHVEPPGTWRYRLRVLSPDGRSAVSDEVIP